MNPFTRKSPEERAAGRPCRRCRHYVKAELHCKFHDKPVEPNGNCEDWNKDTICLDQTTSKYRVTSLPDHVWERPLVRASRLIANKRGRQEYSAKWFEILHIAHEQLIEAHKEGQHVAFQRLAGIAERMLPDSDAWGRYSPVQAGQKEVLDAIIQAAKTLTAEAPEPPTTEPRS